MPVPYQVTCNCGSFLEVESRALDFDGDLFIVVSSCKECLKEAKSKGFKEGCQEHEHS